MNLIAKNKDNLSMVCIFHNKKCVDDYCNSCVVKRCMCVCHRGNKKRRK